MSEWKKYRLGEICSKIGSGATPKGGGNSYKTDGISLIRSQNVYDFVFSSDGLAFISDDQANELRNVEVLEDDILIDITGESVTRCCIVPPEVLPARVSQHVSIIRPLKKLAYFRFVFYYLQSIKPELQLMAEIGCTRRALTKKMLEDLEVCLPSPLEQHAIASVLSSLDDKIDLLQRQNKTLESMAETLYRQIFVEEANDEWDFTQLKDVLNISIGRTPPRKEFHWFSENPDDLKWISIKDMGSSGVFVFNTSEYLTQDAVDSFNIPVIPENSLLLSFKMTVGRVGITTEPILSNEAIAHFVFIKNTPFTKEYLYFFLKNFKYDSLGSTSSIVTAINSKMIKELEIPLPDNNSMEKFKETAEGMFNKIKLNQMQILTLEKLRDMLLPGLIRGDVEVEYNKNFGDEEICKG